jgi:carboxymethylenebutenolidase
MESLYPKVIDDSRRTFLRVTSLPVGFAAAVQPISAQTITTDTNGLVAGEVKVPARDGEIPAYRAHPDKPGKFPVVLVIEEIFGIHEHIKDMCRRFAKAGHYAIAPECFSRQGDPSKIANIQDLIRDIVSKTSDASVLSDIDAAATYAEKSGRGDMSKLGVTGWCWGGRITWLYAAHNPRLKAAAAWYGGLVPRQPSELQPKHPIDVVGDLKCPVLGLYGSKDQGIPLDTVEQMREAAKAAGKTVEIIVYDAQHGFNADYRPSYDKASSEDAMSKLKAWFQKYGAA